MENYVCNTRGNSDRPLYVKYLDENRATLMFWLEIMQLKNCG